MPLSYFIEKPFQNWTYEDSAQIGNVLLHVDCSVPVDPVRQKLMEILHQSALWDGKVANLQVTDALVDQVELRALVSARNPSALWDLRCEVREKLLAFLQVEYPHAPPLQPIQDSGAHSPIETPETGHHDTERCDGGSPQNARPEPAARH